MRNNYRICEEPWENVDGKVHTGYIVEKKYLLFGWVGASTQIFDSIVDAENYLNNIILKKKVVARIY